MKYGPITRETPADRLSEIVLDAVLIISTIASTCYWIILFSQSPAVVWYPLFLLFLAISVRLMARFGYTLPRILCDHSLKFLLAVCSAATLVNIFTNRPDPDDFNFFQRALVSAGDIWRPIDLLNTGFDRPDLPPITPTHLLTSYEVATAYLVKLTGLEPMAVFHYGIGSIAAFILPLVYYSAVRLFGFREWASVVGAAGAVLFLVMSGDTHRDWGNFTLARIWQGKCLIVAIHIPLMWLYVLRFCSTSRRTDLARVGAVAISGIGMTGSGLFLLPWVAASAACGYVIADRISATSRRNALAVFAVVVSAAGVLTLAALQLGPAPLDISVWQEGWPTTALGAAALVIPAGQLPLYSMVVLGGLGLAVRRNIALAVMLGITGSAALLVLPWTGDILARLVTPGAFWRFAYTFPLPLCFALLTAATARQLAPPYTFRDGMLTLASITMLGLFVAQKSHILTDAVLMAPVAAKFELPVQPGARRLAAELPRAAIVLAPEATVVTLGLLRHDLRFVSTRMAETQHVFRNISHSEEGERRMMMQRAVSSCTAFPKTNEKLPHVDVVIIESSCIADSTTVSALLTSLGNQLRIYRSNGEILFW